MAEDGAEAADDADAGRDRKRRNLKLRRHVRQISDVVIGVLIALGLGAVATEIGWRVEVSRARHALEIELGELIGQAEERVKIDGCVERRLDELAALVTAAESTGRLPPLGDIAMPPYLTWPAGVWQSVVSAQTAAHLQRDLLDNYSAAYDFAERIEDQSDAEIGIWTRLHAVGPGRPFRAEEAVALREAISEGRIANRMVGLNGVRMKQVVVAFELGYDQDTAQEYSAPSTSTYPICKAIGAAPPTDYGYAPLEGSIERAIANPITRDNAGVAVAPRR